MYGPNHKGSYWNSRRMGKEVRRNQNGVSGGSPSIKGTKEPRRSCAFETRACFFGSGTSGELRLPAQLSP